jgi:hypothetical protein
MRAMKTIGKVRLSKVKGSMLFLLQQSRLDSDDAANHELHFERRYQVPRPQLSLRKNDAQSSNQQALAVSLSQELGKEVLTEKYTCTGQKYPNNYLTLPPFPPVQPIPIHNIQFKNNSRILFKVIMLMRKKPRKTKKKTKKSPKKTHQRNPCFFPFLRPVGKPSSPMATA